MNDMDPEPVTERTFLSSPDWLGPRWQAVQGSAPDSPRGRLTILDLIGNRSVRIDVAALLWELLARRASMVVVAGPSGVGKTTLLTALFDLIPATERLIRVRGAYDPLRFLAAAPEEAQRTTLAINEISPHLPIYLWGPAVGRLLRAAPRGFRLLATAHAGSAQELVGQLAGYPLRIVPDDIAALHVVVCLDAWRDPRGVRRVVAEITGLAPTDRGGVELFPFLSGAAASIDRHVVDAWLSRRGQSPDDRALATRHNVLEHAVAAPSATTGEAEGLHRWLGNAYREAQGGT